MRRLARTATLALALTLTVSGCGSGAASPRIDAAPARSTTAAPSTPTSAATLERAVRKAILEDHAMSVRILWTNRVPAHPSASGGPELAILRRSVAQRRRAGVRVRVLSEHFRILAVQLASSYATATATVIDDERVQPTYPNGRSRGKPSASHERVHLELHRIGDTERFLVWKVELLR